MRAGPNVGMGEFLGHKIFATMDYKKTLIFLFGYLRRYRGYINRGIGRPRIFLHDTKTANYLDIFLFLLTISFFYLIFNLKFNRIDLANFIFIEIIVRLP
jgi:hypothetical protein